MHYDDNDCISRVPSMWNMLNRAEQVRIPEYKTLAYQTPKTAHNYVQTTVLKHPIKQWRGVNGKRKENNYNDNNKPTKQT